MGKPRQRAVDILGLQHQSGRCGSRASGRTSKQTIANGGRPTASGESFRGEFESWWQRTVAPSPCSAEPAFSAAASFGICAIANFPSGSRQGIRTGDTDSFTSFGAHTSREVARFAQPEWGAQAPYRGKLVAIKAMMVMASRAAPN